MTVLPARAEVVVVGGGAIGASAAFHLAEAGVDVLLLERAELSSGSTGKAAGGVRAQFSDPLNVVMGRRSLEALQRFGDRPGYDVDLRQVGYLFLLDRESDVADFERAVALQNDLGVATRMVTPDEVALLAPLAGLDGVIAATYNPADGHATPDSVVLGYAAGARAHGARVATGCAVTGLTVVDGSIRSVHTHLGEVGTEIVVCCSGAWSAEIAGLAGVELPVEPVLRQVSFTEPVADLPQSIPFTIDFSTGFYFHREGAGLLFGMADRNQPAGLDAPTDPDWMLRILEVAERRCPRLVDMGVAGGWKGYYEVSPDNNALLGEAAGVHRFLYATGFSGHGFMQAPAIGEIVRDLVLGREPFVDVTPLSVDRFARGAPRAERNVI